VDSFAVFRFPALALPRRQATAEAVDGSTLVAPTAASDESLLGQICVGDREALAKLFQRYVRLIRSVAFRILRDQAEAEDLVQDLFLFIQRKSGIFDGSKSSARSWIVQMTYHRAIERRRYLTTRQFYARAAIHDKAERVVGVPTMESDYSAEEVFGRNGLEKVIESLSEDQRETLRLYFFEGYTLAEISEKLGQPRGNIRNHYYRGLSRLRKQMSESSVRLAGRHDK